MTSRPLPTNSLWRQFVISKAKHNMGGKKVTTKSTEPPGLDRRPIDEIAELRRERSLAKEIWDE